MARMWRRRRRRGMYTRTGNVPVEARPEFPVFDTEGEVCLGLPECDSPRSPRTWRIAKS